MLKFLKLQRVRGSKFVMWRNLVIPRVNGISVIANQNTERSVLTFPKHTAIFQIPMRQPLHRRQAVSSTAIKLSMLISFSSRILRRNPSPVAASYSTLLRNRSPSIAQPAVSISVRIQPSSSRFPSSQLLASPRSDHSMAGQSTKGSVYDFTVKDARGNDVDLGIYKGKVLLIVNVASQCGLTNSNYTELSQLYERYKDKGFEILAFPCNQFGSQEPGTNEQILEFACTRFKAEYPIFDKVDVNGANTAPLYKFLKSSKGGLFGDNIKWNFSKFLVDKEGNVVDRYAPTTSPLSIEKDLKKLLGVA